MLRNTLNTFITATLIMLLGVSSSASAQTIVPMGDLMGSTSVTWGDQEETTKSSALRVDLVPAKPRIKQDTSDESNDEQQPGEPVTVTYTITSEANGPDDYALATSYDNDVPSTNITAQPTTEILGPDDQPASVNLGATAATGPTDKDSRTITVLCDAASSSEISCNGIDALDTVIIGNGDTAYEVAEVSNPDEGPSTITINLDEGLELPSIVVGTRIAEQKTFKVVVSGVALQNPAESGAVALVVTGTSTDGNQTGQAPLAFDVKANPIPRSVDRYVRNLTDINRNPVTSPPSNRTQFQNGELVDEGGVNYYKTGVSAKEGDELEILIVMNAGNLADQSNISLLETLSPFVTYVAGSAILYGEPIEDDVFAWIAGGVKPADMSGGPRPNITIRKNNSATLVFKVTVIGGDGDGSGDDSQTAIAATYLGCLSDDSEVSAICEKDGTLWADVPVANRVNQTACWKGQWDGEWVVGANDLSRTWGDNQQEVLRGYADAGEYKVSAWVRTRKIDVFCDGGWQGLERGAIDALCDGGWQDWTGECKSK